MITYRKKSLRVHNISSKGCNSRYETYSEYISKKLKDFIENGEYSRIVDIKIYGKAYPDCLMCSIIYEVKK